MKKTLKAIICIALVAVLMASFAGCAKIGYVTNGTIKAINEVKSGEWQNGGADAEAGDENGDAAADAVVLEQEFQAGNVGGVDFASQDDIVNYYVECYNNTKAQTAQYDENGETKTYYALLGTEDLKIDSVLIEGKENSVINNLVPGIVGGMFSASTYGLPPCCNRDPNLDNNSDDQFRKNDHTFNTSYLKPEDVLAAYATDNGDGTITLYIQPKAAELSMRGEDSQGNFFEVLGDISSTVAQISVLSWAEGDANSNVKVYYKGGTGVITVDTASKTITAADYHMAVTVAVSHANVTVIKNKSATVQISYDMHYPADDGYLMEKRSIKRL